eukprot:1150255-Pelagomonas_calceolata.AAC.5
MDHFWTYNGPQCPNAVQWSQDNLLAVACAHNAVILAPGHLDGPRASASPPNPAASGSTEGLCVGGVPKEPEKSEGLVWAVAGETRAEEGSNSSVGRTHVRALAWSPPGCTPNAGCYLTLVSTDNKVRAGGGPGSRTACASLFAPSTNHPHHVAGPAARYTDILQTAHSLSCEWELAIDASSMLKQQLMDTDWKEVDDLVSSSLEPGNTAGTDGYDAQGVQGLLRLRGGCSFPMLHGEESRQSLGLTPAAAAAATAPGYMTAGMEGPVLRLRGGGRKRKAIEAPTAAANDAAGRDAQAAGDAGEEGTIAAAAAAAAAAATAAADAAAKAAKAEDRPAMPTSTPGGQAPALPSRGTSARSMARAAKAEAANRAPAQTPAASTALAAAAQEPTQQQGDASAAGCHAAAGAAAGGDAAKAPRGQRVSAAAAAAAAAAVTTAPHSTAVPAVSAAAAAAEAAAGEEAEPDKAHTQRGCRKAGQAGERPDLAGGLKAKTDSSSTRAAGSSKLAAGSNKKAADSSKLTAGSFTAIVDSSGKEAGAGSSRARPAYSSKKGGKAMVVDGTEKPMASATPRRATGALRIGLCVCVIRLESMRFVHDPFMHGSGVLNLLPGMPQPM